MAKDNAQGNQTAQDGRELEVLGTCQTQPSMDAQHEHNVTPAQVWSYAQEEALVSVSDQHDHDKCYRLLPDAEDRARRIAARYAGLYFDSAAKSKGKVQFYWPALAAFVVKDIVEAYRFDRENVLEGGWGNAMRTSAVPTLFSEALSSASPYAHAMRVYVALAKGNLWLYMDIYPWLYFFLRFGIKQDGSLNEARIRSHVEQRNATEYQQQSRKAVEDLPFGRAWFARQQARQANDPVYKRAKQYFPTQPSWSMDGGYGAHTAAAYQAHNYVRAHIASYDGGYHLPVAAKWQPIREAFYVMEEERVELTRVAQDNAAFSRLEKIAKFPTTAEVRDTYDLLISEFHGGPEAQSTTQLKELKLIAAQEQLNILQPLIYDDQKLKETMDMNHRFARASGGIMTTKYRVIYSAAPTTDNPKLQTVFDPPSGRWSGVWHGIINHQKSLPNANDRMKYVGQIASDFHNLMLTQREYMEKQLREIQKRGGEKHA
ncbi:MULTISPECIES: hypothetical protein [unclassified Achromobacter]|uniref:DUF2515 family protein n=1 Tax=unclassified Achromobacter TaxID=2626865 RepID=UPI000B51CEA3|nr:MULTISPECIES: hypothetical protein [unclassified Achromobacter]OWT71422.1 hypothetical protein CEY05_24855 [Achromobacter sp. HZ34]OWT73079.1 hypothetical protein CEY04_23690 [Achromobacter sp. HZ28]